MRNEDIGARIRARRDYLRISQTKLAEMFGVSRGTMSNYESGNRTIDIHGLARMAELLRVPVSYFFGESKFEGDDSDERRPQLIAFYDDLTPDAQDDLLALARSIWERKRKTEHVHGSIVPDDIADEGSKDR